MSARKAGRSSCEREETAGMAHRLLTLGTLAVLDESGRALDFPHGKPLALLIRLVVGPEPPTRRDLVHLLWSRSTMERGLQSVRQALWLIRKSLGEDVLESNDTVRLAPGALTSDVSDLERALEQGRIADAAALWRGAFLHRFAVADAPEWDRWVDSVHDDLSRRLANAVFSEAQRYRDASDVPGARRAMERAVEIAPFEPRYRGGEGAGGSPAGGGSAGRAECPGAPERAGGRAPGGPGVGSR
jgi:DNA-binding SARP family transcriptional activator